MARRNLNPFGLSPTARAAATLSALAGLASAAWGQAAPDAAALAWRGSAMQKRVTPASHDAAIEPPCASTMEPPEIGRAHV